MFNWLKSKIPGNNGKYEHQPLIPRKVNISGTVFYFAMPENFSPDMPGDDLVEQVDLANFRELRDDSAIPLMKRWWDFYYGKPSTKNTIGTLMLSLDILPKKKNIEGSLFDHDPMVNAVYRDLLDGFSVSSAEEGEQKGVALLPRSASELTEFKNNDCNWVVAGAAYMDRDTDGVNTYSTPISDDWYLRAWFLFPSGGGKNSGIFHRRALGEQMRMLESFTLEFPFRVPKREPVKVSMFQAISKEEQDAFHERNKKYYLE